MDQAPVLEDIDLMNLSLVRLTCLAERILILILILSLSLSLSLSL